MIPIAILMLVDFILTYIGISLGIIVEANPIWVWVFELPLPLIMLVRMAYIAVIVALVYIVYRKRRTAYRWIVVFGCVVNVVVLALHIRWIVLLG